MLGLEGMLKEGAGGHGRRLWRSRAT